MCGERSPKHSSIVSNPEKAPNSEKCGVHVRGDKNRVGADVQRDRQKIFGRKPQNRAPVRMNVADRLQFQSEPFRGVERGEQDDVMYFPHFSVLLVNATDLARDHKARRNGKIAEIRKAQVFFEPIQSLFGGDQGVFHLLPPGGMGKIARAHERNALASRPQIEIGKISVFARRARILGMNVQIGYVHSFLLKLISCVSFIPQA